MPQATSAVANAVRDGQPEPGAPTVGKYLIDRPPAQGVEHVFGIPGCSVLTLYNLLPGSPNPVA